MLRFEKNHNVQGWMLKVRVFVCCASVVCRALTLNAAEQKPSTASSVQQSTPQTDTAKPKERKISRAIFTHATVEGAIHERKGPNLLVGGGLAWVTEFSSGWFFSPSVTGFGGPREHMEGGMVSGFGIISSLSGGYHFHNSRAAIGPAVGVGVKWQRLDAVFDDAEDQSQSVVNFRGSVSIDGHVFITSHLALAMRLDLAFLSNPTEFRKSADTDVFLITPWLEGAVFAGFRFFL
jgi:hypothetical protein